MTQYAKKHNKMGHPGKVKMSGVRKVDTIYVPIAGGGILGSNIINGPVLEVKEDVRGKVLSVDDDLKPKKSHSKFTWYAVGAAVVVLFLLSN